ncbi:MAG: helix-turn-helix domain-containing protein [Bacteroidota bacterium]
MTTLYIKNMVCDRCIAAVRGELEKSEIPYESIGLGEVELEKLPAPQTLKNFSDAIRSIGFELIEDKTARTINYIKKTVIEWVRGEETRHRKIKFSSHLAEMLHKDYASLSNLFSGVEGTTIEQYLIHQKIERVKELLVYDELSLGQISDQLNYSSVQHLSNQFRKVTGLTPSHFKKIGAGKRLPLDKV